MAGYLEYNSPRGESKLAVTALAYVLHLSLHLHHFRPCEPNHKKQRQVLRLALALGLGWLTDAHSHGWLSPCKSARFHDFLTLG